MSEHTIFKYMELLSCFAVYAFTCRNLIMHKENGNQTLYALIAHLICTDVTVQAINMRELLRYKEAGAISRGVYMQIIQNTVAMSTSIMNILTLQEYKQIFLHVFRFKSIGTETIEI